MEPLPRRTERPAAHALLLLCTESVDGEPFFLDLLFEQHPELGLERLFPSGLEMILYQVAEIREGSWKDLLVLSWARRAVSEHLGFHLGMAFEATLQTPHWGRLGCC